MRRGIRKHLRGVGVLIIVYKIPDLKEDIKERLTQWSQDRKGYFSDEVLDLHDIVDKAFEKIERTTEGWKTRINGCCFKFGK